MPDSKVVKFKGEVVDAPNVRRNQAGQPLAIDFTVKAPFKGVVEVRAQGDIASAYWSLTPGMKVAVEGKEEGKGRYKAESLDVVND